MEKRDEIVDLLDFIICGQLLVERAESIPENLNRRKIKKLTKELIKELTPTVEQYNKIYMAEETMSREIVWELDKFCKQTATGDLYERVYLSQCQEAYRISKDKAQKHIHSIIRENVKN